MRNEKLRFSRIMCSIFAILGAIVLITLVVFDILLDVVPNQNNTSVFVGGLVVDIILIIGGGAGAIHCWTRHNILTCPEKFKEWYGFIFFFHLLFIGFIPFGFFKAINEGTNKGTNNDKDGTNDDEKDGTNNDNRDK
jgi:hypothetical protein